jgi:GrpB-like predicted nucleotidyltransferase (UPF0157 family)
MVGYNSDFWKRHLLFRDYLRVHPHAAREYNNLKRELAAKYRRNADAYTEAKTLFIESIVSKAGCSNHLKEKGRVLTKRSDLRGSLG